MGVSVDTRSDTVFVDGRVVQPVSKYSYIMLYKPKGCITSVSDDKGRKTVFDYLRDVSVPHLVPVGRLDYDTEGLLILTNDGDAVYALTHPSHEVEKTYIVKVEGEIPEHKLAQLRKGVILDDGTKAGRSKVKLLAFEDGVSKLQVTISEGKNRQIRRMFAAVGEEVVFLKRIAVGAIRLGGLARGAYRYLNDAEIAYIKTL